MAHRIWLGLVIFSLAAIVPVFAAEPETAAAPSQSDAAAAPASVADSKGSPSDARLTKTWYALGLLLSRNLEDYQLSAAEFSEVQAGLLDGFDHRRSDVDLAAATAELQTLRRERYALLVKNQEEAARAYLAEAAALPHAKTTASGLVFIPIESGSGASPHHDDRVKVNYEGRLGNGTIFDSSLKRGGPVSVNVAGVIPCWSEALQLMKVGGKSRVICPPKLAYGEGGAPPFILPQSALDFQFELLEVSAAPPARKAGH